MRLLLIVVFSGCSVLSNAQIEFWFAMSGKKEKKAFKESVEQLIDAFRNNDASYIETHSRSEVYCLVCNWKVNENYPPKNYYVPIDTFINQYNGVLPLNKISKAIDSGYYKISVKSSYRQRVFNIVIHSSRSDSEQEKQHHELWFRKEKSDFIFEGISSTP